jgi:hypothetical protein
MDRLGIEHHAQTTQTEAEILIELANAGELKRSYLDRT